MLSVPPARITSASPRRMVRAAESIAWRPEAQAWLTVNAGRSDGEAGPEADLAGGVRTAAGLAAVAEDHLVDPRRVEPRPLAGRPLAAAVPRSAAERDASAPTNLPIGVRTGATAAKCVSRRPAA